MRKTPLLFPCFVFGAALCAATPVLLGQAAGVTPDMVQSGSDIPAKWEEPHPGYDYEKRVVMIPMRDGVKLHTVILVPKGAKGLPMLLERTPYNADHFITDKPHMRDAAWSAQREWADDGYILVDQDIRGKYGSEGDYVMTRPPIGPLNPTKTDDTTDAYDTIDWLVKNVPESNGRVGMIGSSYDGWTVTMALLGPHPALKVAAPESPMIDGWMGDDWFHYGAFRQVNLDYFTEQSSVRGEGMIVPRPGDDDYQNFLDAGTAGSWAELNGLKQLPWWNRLSAHPAYDAFWQLQALDKLVVQKPASIPTLWLQGLWDQEDMYGAVHTWEALKAAGHAANNHLVMGPWCHSQVNRGAESLGPLKWKGDTAADFRREVLIPFFNTYLKDRKPAEALAPVMIYNPSENHWDTFADWPKVDEKHLTPMYLQAKFGLGLAKPEHGEDSYVSDPAKPVPYLTPPVEANGGKRWTTWLVQDQRPMGTRTDVLSYQTPVLENSSARARRPVCGPVCEDDGNRHGLRGEDHRRVSAERRGAAGNGGLRARDQHGHLPRALPEELHRTRSDPGGRGAGIPFPAAHGELRVQARAPHHGADSVVAVSALRSQSANVCSQHLFRQAGGLSRGDHHGGARRRRGRARCCCRLESTPGN